MSDGLDFLMRPVLRGMIPYSALRDRSIDLEDVARMNEALDVEAENVRRIRKNG